MKGLNGRRDLFALSVVFLIFLWALLPQTQNYPYYYDDFYVFQRAREIATDPLAAWSPEVRSGRHHPVYFYFLYLENVFFGFKATGYFLVLFLLHFLNSILVIRLSRTLGGGALAPLLSGLLFLCSTSFYQTLIFIQAIVRVLCIFLFLLGIFSWIKFLRYQSPLAFLQTIFWYLASLFTMEDALVFPFLATFLVFQIAPNEKVRQRVLFRFCPLLFLVDLLILVPFLKGLSLTPLGIQKITWPRSLIAKFVSLFEMLLRPLLIPEKGFFSFLGVHENWVRLGPLFFSLLLLFGLFSRIERVKFFIQGIPWRVLSTAIGWVGLSILPFLFQRLTFEHANRYLYLPLVGFSVMFGLVTARLIETYRVHAPKTGLIFYFLTLPYILGLNLQGTAYHYQRYVQYVNRYREQHYYERVQSLFEKREIPTEKGRG